MKRIGFIWDKFISDDNIDRAYEQAIKKIKNEDEYAKYRNRKQEYINELKDMLNNNTWKHSPYTQRKFTIRVKKEH